MDKGIQKSTNRPYIFMRERKYMDERLGYLTYAIPKIRENIRRLEDDMLNARNQLQDYEQERKEIINGTERK